MQSSFGQRNRLLQVEAKQKPAKGMAGAAQKIYEILDEHPENHNYGIDRILLALN